MAGGGNDASLTDNDFKNFIISNGVVTATVAITIGIATASFIKAIVADLMMPGFYIVFGNYILQHVSAKAFKKMTQLFEDRSIINLDAFFKEFITWIFIILGSYVLLNFIVNKWFLGNNDVLSPSANVNPIPYYASSFPMV
jgi:large-conductance mechanosensitive channel